jgi:uracil-DNA glycosylase
MEHENNEDLLIHIPYGEVESNLHGIQIIAYVVKCTQYDESNHTSIVTHKPGTVKLCKTRDGKKCIAMYCVVMLQKGKYEEYVDDKLTLKYYKMCLDKISRAKNLKSIVFSGGINDKYVVVLQEFSERVEALVYVYKNTSTKNVKDVKDVKCVKNTGSDAATSDVLYQNITNVSCKAGISCNTIHKSFGDLLGQIKLWKKEKTGWDTFFQARIHDKTIATLNAFLQKEAEQYNVYPQPEEIFNAMISTRVGDIKVIVIGQDVYYTPGAAMGLAFSHKDDYGKLQPSLRNIYTELKDCGYKVNKSSGNLLKWAHQGVFLINTALTVREGQAGSHMKKWKSFTEHLFTFLNKEIEHAVIIMWGAPAQTYSKYFDDKKHKKIISSHPCPMSARISFFGSKPFVKCNQYLKEWGIKEIDWNLV